MKFPCRQDRARREVDEVGRLARTILSIERDLVSDEALFVKNLNTGQEIIICWWSASFHSSNAVLTFGHDV